jgi:hypothetical protein
MCPFQQRFTEILLGLLVEDEFSVPPEIVSEKLRK